MQISIAPIDDDLAPSLQGLIDGKTKPPGSLGRLEALALQIGQIRGSLEPQLDNPRLLVFAGDHGAALAGVSAYPQDVTWQMVENFLAGGAAINVFARQSGMQLEVVDAGVAHEFGPRAGLVNAKIAPGTRNYIDEPAMSVDQCQLALQRGRDIAHRIAASGTAVLGFGEMGIGNTASASLLTHCLTHAELESVTGRGTGLDDQGMARKRALLGLAVTRGGRPRDPVEALCEYGGFEIAMMAGAMLGAAERRLVVLVDGFIATAATLVAHAICAGVLPYCVFAHRSQEPGHAIQHAQLDAHPLLSLELRLGEGTGAALAYPLLRAATGFLAEMASFDSAGVSGRSD